MTLVDMREEDLPWFFGQISQQTAKGLGIQEVEWKSPLELDAEIKQHAEAHKALQAFFAAYRDWVVEPTQQTADRRDETRGTLLKLLKKGA